MSLVIPNFVKTALAAPVSTSDTELHLTPGTGSLFNSVGYGNWCYVTVNDSTTVEVMRYVSTGNVVADTIPVVRGQDNTTPKAFPVGACVAIGWNVGQIMGLIDQEIIRLMPMGPRGPTGPTGDSPILTPYDFGAVGDGVADDYDALQNWLLAVRDGVGYGKAGTFMTTAPLTIYSNTTIWGAGKGNFRITTAQGVPQNYVLLRNVNPLSSTPRVDENIAIYGTCFEGDPFTAVSGVPTTKFVALIGVTGLIIRDSLFQHRRHSALDLSNNIDMVIDSNEFYDWGSGLSGTGDSGIAINCYAQSYRSSITNNYIHDSQSGAGIHLSVENNTEASPPPPGNFFICSGNNIVNVGEFGLVGAPGGSVVSNNNIYNVVRIDASGNGAQMNGYDYTFTGNVIERCAGACAIFSNVENVIIANNDFNAPAQDATDAHTGALIIANQAEATGFGATAPRNVTITGNQMVSTAAPGQHAITFANNGDPTHLMTNIHCHGNNFGAAGAWTGAVLDYFPSANEIIGENFIHRNNLGSADVDSYTNETFVDTGTAGVIIISDVPYKPRTLYIEAVIQTGTVTLLSQCAGAVNNDLTMPSKSLAADAAGFNSVTGTGIKLYDGAGTLLVDGSVIMFIPQGFAILFNNPTLAPTYINYTAYP